MSEPESAMKLGESPAEECCMKLTEGGGEAIRGTLVGNVLGLVTLRPSMDQKTSERTTLSPHHITLLIENAA